MLQLAGDGSDTQSQKAAFAFLSKSVSVWGQPSFDGTNGEIVPGSQGVPGFERFVYDNVVPTAFAVLSLPDLNIKDGQVLVVSVIRFSSCCSVTYSLTSSGPPRNCRTSANDWESPGTGGIQILRLCLSTRPKLARGDCVRIYDEDARSGFEAVPQIFRRFRQGLTIWLVTHVIPTSLEITLTVQRST
jgi:hypothetical protein